MTILFLCFSGPNRLPAGREERPGELEERPCAEDQNAGIRAEAREVSAYSAHPQHTKIPQLACNNCSVVDAAINKILPMRKIHFSVTSILSIVQFAILSILFCFLSWFQGRQYLESNCRNISGQERVLLCLSLDINGAASTHI